MMNALFSRKSKSKPPTGPKQETQPQTQQSRPSMLGMKNKKPIQYEVQGKPNIPSGRSKQQKTISQPRGSNHATLNNNNILGEQNLDGLTLNVAPQYESDCRQDQFMLKKQYNQKDYEQLAEENTILRENIEINKSIIRQFMTTGVDGDSINAQIQKLINDKVWGNECRMKQIIQEKETLEAELLIKDQIMSAMKLQEKQLEEMYEEQLEEMRDKLERKEYVCQYKEEVWSTFERELKKVIKKDSILYQKIQSTTQILVENLNTTKISNVVKENHIMIEDQRKMQSVIDKLLKDCQEVIDEDENMFKKYSSTSSHNHHFNIPQILTPKVLTQNTMKENSNELSVVLSHKLEQLLALVDSIKNRVSLLDDENCFLRSEYQRLTKQNLNINKQNLILQEKIKGIYDNISNPTPTQHKSTKVGTISDINSSQYNCTEYGGGAIDPTQFGQNRQSIPQKPTQNNDIGYQQFTVPQTLPSQRDSQKNHNLYLKQKNNFHQLNNIKNPHSNQQINTHRTHLNPSHNIQNNIDPENRQSLSSFSINLHPVTQPTPGSSDQNTPDSQNQQLSDEHRQGNNATRGRGVERFKGDMQGLNEQIALKLSGIEINLNKFLNQSPEYMMKKKPQNNMNNKLNIDNKNLRTDGTVKHQSQSKQMQLQTTKKQVRKQSDKNRKPKTMKSMKDKPMTLDELEKGIASSHNNSNVDGSIYHTEDDEDDQVEVGSQVIEDQYQQYDSDEDNDKENRPVVLRSINKHVRAAYDDQNDNNMNISAIKYVHHGSPFFEHSQDNSFKGSLFLA
eukprot:403377354